MVRQRKPGWTHAGDQHFQTVIRFFHVLRFTQRVPARQQVVDLDAPRQAKDVGQRTRFDFGNIDRRLLLVNAGLHAIVTDAVAGGRAHRVVEHDHCQCTDANAVAAQDMHLGDFFVQRATGERDAERVLFQSLIRLAFLFREPFRTKIAIVVMAVNAVVHFGLHLAHAHAPVGQGKAVAQSARRFRPLDTKVRLFLDANGRDQAGIVAPLRHGKADPAFHRGLAFVGGERADTPACH